MPAHNYLLQFNADRLELIESNGKMPPVSVDFLAGKLIYRRQHATLRNELLARAMGLKKNTKPYIVDATGGLGRDSFILACLGFEITVLERSPMIYALLADGIKRGLENNSLAPIMRRLHLMEADTIGWLNSQQNHPDIIYLDPMFPPRQKSALVKKEMRIFHDIIGDDLDREELLKTALLYAKKRVVVKHPRLGAPINGPQPSFNVTGSSSRFDIYLI